MLRKRFAAFFAFAAAVASAALACSLDLDEKLLAKGRDGGPVTIGDASLPDGTVISESGVPILPNAAACTKDEECVAANACLKGRCDLSRRACSYDICRTTTCNIGTCDQATKACSAAQPYKLKAGEMALEQPSSSIIAAYPFLFQMTPGGVFIYDVSNPTRPKPPTIPLVGLGFNANQFVRSGNRIWIAGPLVGTPARLPVAYIDIPADPFVTQMEAHTILTSYNRPDGESVGLAPSTDRAAFAIGPQTADFPTALFDTLLAEPATKAANPLKAKPDTYPIGVSGSRLFMQQMTTNPLLGVQAQNQFGLITGGGTTAPVASDLVKLTNATEVSNSRGTASTINGALFFATGIHQSNGDPDAPANVTVRVSGLFLMKDAASPIDTAAKAVEIEAYPLATAPAANTAVLGGVGMIDDDTAVVAVSVAGTPDLSAIQIVKRDGTVPKDKRVTVPTPIAKIPAVSTSNGLIYVAANIAGGATDTGKLFIIDPACTP